MSKKYTIETKVAYGNDITEPYVETDGKAILTEDEVRELASQLPEREPINEIDWGKYIKKQPHVKIKKTGEVKRVRSTNWDAKQVHTYGVFHTWYTFDDIEFITDEEDVKGEFEEINLTTTQEIWHEDGIGKYVGDSHTEVKVYQNGELKDTGGKWEHLLITTELNWEDENNKISPATTTNHRIKMQNKGTGYVSDCCGAEFETGCYRYSHYCLSCGEPCEAVGEKCGQCELAQMRGRDKCSAHDTKPDLDWHSLSKKDMQRSVKDKLQDAKPDPIELENMWQRVGSGDNTSGVGYLVELDHDAIAENIEKMAEIINYLLSNHE